jgi:hypothetical protein
VRKLALLLFFAVMAVPAFAAKRVTVAQLEQTLTAIHGKTDAEVARKIYELELSDLALRTRPS